MATTTEQFADNLRLATQMRPALVLYFKRKTGCAVEAEDLAQDVLARAVAHAQWGSPEQAKGYIFRIAVNRWRDFLRRGQTHGVAVEWDEQAERALGVEDPPERGLILNEELHQVAGVLAGLSVRTRTIVMLIKIERMKAASVAELLGISVSAVSKHLAQAVAELSALRRRQERP